MFKKIAIAAALAMIASSSFAADVAGVYAGASVGSTKVDGLSGHKTSLIGFVGYQFTDALAAEASYGRVAKYDFYPATVKMNQTALSVVGSVPMGNGFKLFGRLGYNYMEATGSAGSYSHTESTSKALYGIGVSYAIVQNVSARFEVTKPSSDATNVALGVAYKF
ncbi:MAG: outer membrane beta-barrel protein [Pseudomonadota bacterium]